MACNVVSEFLSFRKPVKTPKPPVTVGNRKFFGRFADAHEGVGARTASFVPHGRGDHETSRTADNHDTSTDAPCMAHVRSTRRPSTGRLKWYTQRLAWQEHGFVLHQNESISDKKIYACVAAHVSSKNGKMSKI
jgi:hypothetical protein